MKSLPEGWLVLDQQEYRGLIIKAKKRGGSVLYCMKAELFPPPKIDTPVLNEFESSSIENVKKHIDDLYTFPFVQEGGEIKDLMGAQK